MIIVLKSIYLVYVFFLEVTEQQALEQIEMEEKFGAASTSASTVQEKKTKYVLFQLFRIVWCFINNKQ